LLEAALKYCNAIESDVRDDAASTSKVGLPPQAAYYFRVIRFLLHHGAKYAVLFATIVLLSHVETDCLISRLLKVEYV